jgi:sigma-B regulation protein RsbU (phosphoserine phosphatase)
MPTGKKARILVVDDDPMLRQLLISSLETKGFQLDQAGDGEEGLACLRQQCPDLLLCDVQMPRIDGLEVLKVARQEYPHLPVIMISGAGFIQDVAAALRLGAWDYLIKPFTSLAVVEHAVNQGLHRARLEQENRDYREILEQTNRELASSLATLREDQEAGRQVQASLLPEDRCCFGEYCFSHVLLPSLYLSGDFLDCFPIDQRYLGLYIADVSGHGSSSAFLTVLLKSLVSQLRRRYQNTGDDLIINPEQVLGHLNREILNTDFGKYLTMVYFVLDMRDELLHYCVGGHYPRPVFVGNGKAEFVSGHGLPVGLFEDAAYRAEKLEIPRTFSLTMFSDGLLDTLDGKNLEDKEHVLLELCSRPDISIDTVAKGLNLETVAMPADDITVCMLQRKG